jgi:glycosyltransferase involved in cell wall biosynthesis
VVVAQRSLSVGVFGARGIPSTYSGYETFLTVLLPELARRGHAVTMYCRKGEVETRPSYAGVRCVHLPAVRSKQLSTPSHGMVAAGRAFAAGHDALLVVNVANALACLACRGLGQRVVLNTDGQEWTRSKWGRVGRGVFLTSAHLARWSASALVADSVAMRDIYASRFHAPSTVIPYCWPGLVPAPAGDLASFGLERRRYFVVAGRLVPENNIDAVARAYLATDIPFPLVVLGAANYRSPVAQALDDMARQDARLVVLGHVEDRRTFALLVAEARAYVHGHSVGGINPSLIEAMGCRARILALDTPFNREAVGPTGEYFADPATDLGPLLRAVAAELPAHGQRRRDAAGERARTSFSLEAVADAYEGLLLAVSERSSWRRTALAGRWDAAGE